MTSARERCLAQLCLPCPELFGRKAGRPLRGVDFEHELIAWHPTNGRRRRDVTCAYAIRAVAVSSARIRVICAAITEAILLDDLERNGGRLLRRSGSDQSDQNDDQGPRYKSCGHRLSSPQKQSKAVSFANRESPHVGIPVAAIIQNEDSQFKMKRGYRRSGTKIRSSTTERVVQRRPSRYGSIRESFNQPIDSPIARIRSTAQLRLLQDVALARVPDAPYPLGPKTRRSEKTSGSRTS